jgi:acetylornithine deacetylase
MKETIDLLSRLIATPSVSGKEQETAGILSRYLASKTGVSVSTVGNNVIAIKEPFRENKPVVLLCSHHDTVAPSAGYTRDPYTPELNKDKDGRMRLYGLGSNDAGASVVAMMKAFCTTDHLPYNLVLILAAEEEISGKKGIASALPHVPDISCALVGEPTGLRAATGERGLLVLDGIARGQSAHAALGGGTNALYKALDAVALLRHYRFLKESPAMGSVHLQVTQIQAGTQHNVVPDTCRYVVDIRTTDVYTNAEILEKLESVLPGCLTPRNMANKASATPYNHPLAKAVKEAGLPTYISPTTSDWMRLPCPALKIGPGCSSRSHTPDEFIYIDEIEQGIATYKHLLSILTL